MNRIEIRRLEVYAFHGVFEEEKRLGQKFYVSIKLELDTDAAASSDDITKSVNYGEVCQVVTEFMQNACFKLIETTADRLAMMLLERYELVSKVIIDLEKPNAPIPYPIDTVLVHMERSRHQVYLSLGSNMGDRSDYINRAIRMLDGHESIKVKKIAGVIETAPYGYTDQDPFMNTCVLIETYLNPEPLLDVLNGIEAELGRIRQIHWGPRCVDLDIIFYDNCVIDTKRLHIPHIDMQNRQFVLEPLAEIAPYMRHPYLNKTVKQLLEELSK